MDRSVALTPALRKEYKSLIERRVTTILKSLESEMRGDEESITAHIRQENGILLDQNQLKQLISDLDHQIEEIVSVNLPDAKRDIEIKLDELEERYKERIQTIKNQARIQCDDLEEEMRRERDKLREGMKNARDQLAKDFASDLVLQKEEFTNQLIKTRGVEIGIHGEVMKRATLIRQSKERLKSLISDAAGRALENLMSSLTSETAKKLVESIPTVSEALVMINGGQKGMHNFFLKLDPNTPPLLAPPVSVRSANGDGDGDNGDEDSDEDSYLEAEEVFEEEI